VSVYISSLATFIERMIWAFSPIKYTCLSFDLEVIWVLGHGYIKRNRMNLPGCPELVQQNLVVESFKLDTLRPWLAALQYPLPMKTSEGNYPKNLRLKWAHLGFETGLPLEPNFSAIRRGLGRGTWRKSLMNFVVFLLDLSWRLWILVIRLRRRWCSWGEKKKKKELIQWEEE